MRRNIGSFDKIGSALVLCWVEVASLNTDPVRYAVMDVAGVVVSSSWKSSGERIDPCT